jgi:hypothetical protein
MGSVHRCFQLRRISLPRQGALGSAVTGQNLIVEAKWGQGWTLDISEQTILKERERVTT